MSLDELDVPEYNKDGDNYYFTKQELEAFIAQDPSTHDALLQAAKKANQDQRITAGLDPATKPLDEQILRDIFNGNGLNYSQIVGDELTTVSMGLQDFNYSLKQVLALIATQVREARIDELGKLMPPVADMIPEWKWPCYVCGFDRELLRKHIEDRIAALKGDK